jgi:cytochrome bd-type quinol oxidase subunit 2
VPTLQPWYRADEVASLNPWAIAIAISLVAFLGLATVLHKAIVDPRDRRERTIALFVGSLIVPAMVANILSGTAGYPPGHPYARREFWLPPTLFVLAVGIVMLVVALRPRRR